MLNKTFVVKTNKNLCSQDREHDHVTYVNTRKKHFWQEETFRLLSTITSEIYIFFALSMLIYGVFFTATEKGSNIFFLLVKIPCENPPQK